MLIALFVIPRNEESPRVALQKLSIFIAEFLSGDCFASSLSLVSSLLGMAIVTYINIKHKKTVKLLNGFFILKSISFKTSWDHLLDNLLQNLLLRFRFLQNHLPLHRRPDRCLLNHQLH